MHQTVSALRNCKHFTAIRNTFNHSVKVYLWHAYNVCYSLPLMRDFTMNSYAKAPNVFTTYRIENILFLIYDDLLIVEVFKDPGGSTGAVLHSESI